MCTALHWKQIHSHCSHPSAEKNSRSEWSGASCCGSETNLYMLIWYTEIVTILWLLRHYHWSYRICIHSFIRDCHPSIEALRCVALRYRCLDGVGRRRYGIENNRNQITMTGFLFTTLSSIELSRNEGSETGCSDRDSYLYN